MTRYSRAASVATVSLGLFLMIAAPGFPAPNRAAGDRAPRDRGAGIRLGPFADRLARGFGVRVDRQGHPVPIGTEELEFYARFLAIDAKGTPPTARVRMRLDRGARNAIESMGIRTYGSLEGFSSAVIPIDRMREVAGISGIELMQVIRIPQLELDASMVDIGSAQAQLPANFGARGAGAIVGLIDTGADVTHEDLRKPGGDTRILYYWNQQEPCTGSPPPPPFNFGCLYTEADINLELAVPGSITAADANGHGTHVIGTAAGDGSATGNGVPAYTYVGAAPDADIIVVKTFPEPGTSCSTCFEIGLGLDFIDTQAAALGKPYVVNMSLGSQYGGHDGSDIDEITIDTLTGPGIPGAAVVKSAGNSRGAGIHASGVVSTGTTNTHTFTISNYAPLPGIFNDVQAWSLWYEGGDILTVSIEDPTTAPCGATVESVTMTTGGGQVFNSTLSGSLLIDDTASPAPNGARFFDMEVDDQSGDAPCRGTWTVRVTGDTITAGGRYDMYIWFSSFGINEDYSDWNAPDYTGLISVPGTAFNTTTVGAYVTKESWLSIDTNTYWFGPAQVGSLASFSSPGPSRDGRLKPEIAAPGWVIASALSSDASADPALVVPDGVHWINLGTSMAAPHVTGIYAQILGLNPNLDAIQLRTLLTETARSDIYTGAVPNNNWGYGKPDALAAMQDPRARVVIDLMMSGAGGSWMGLGTADSYNVYKADIGALDGVFFGSCFLPGTPSPSFNDPAIPAVGSGFAYTVTGVLGGVEGPVRHDWTTGTSVLIPPGDTCP